MIIVVDNTSHIVGMAGAEGSDVTGANWCDKYTLAGFTAVSGVTLPAGYLNNCFTYISGVFAIVPGKEALVAAQILRGTTVPTLSSGDISLGGSTLSDGVTQVSLEVLVHPVAESTSYEIRYTSTKDGIFDADIFDDDIFSDEIYSYVTVLEPGLVNIAGLKANTDYSIALRAYGMYGVSAWTADVVKTTDTNLTDSLLAELTSDNKFTAVEKSQFKPQYDSMVAEQSAILSAVTNMAVTAISDLYTTYAGHLVTLTAYVASTSLFTDMYVTTDITGATLKTAIQNVLTSKSILNTAMASYYGRAGLNGTRTAILDIYISAVDAPTTFPAGTSTYTWATGQFTDPTTLNGWSRTPPTVGAGETLWIARQLYSDNLTAATTDIEWEATFARAAGGNGADGANGARTAYLEVYQWLPTGTTSFTYPAGDSTYTWATGAFTAPATANGWSLLPGAATKGYTLFACSVAYADVLTTSTTTINWSGHTTAYPIGVAGLDGVDSIRVILSNENHTLSALNDGTVTDFSGATCTATVYNGTIADATWTCVQTRSAGLTVTEATSSKTATVTGLSTAYDSATITFTLSKDGYSDIVATFSLAKSKGGAVGAVGPSLLLTSSKQAFTAVDDVLDEGIFEDDIFEADIFNEDQAPITFVATLSGLPGGVTWSSSPAVTLGGSGLVKTLAMADFGLNDQVTVTATSVDNTNIFDSITVVRLSTRFTPEPYATVGAPTGTVIHDRTAEQVVADTAAAAQTASYPSISNIPNNILLAGQSAQVSLLNTDITITNTGGVITLSGAGGGSVNVDIIITNSFKTNTFTLGDATHDGVIQTHGWDGIVPGIKISGGASPAIDIIGGNLSACTITADQIILGSGDIATGTPMTAYGSYGTVPSNTVYIEMSWLQASMIKQNDIGLNLLGNMSGTSTSGIKQGILLKSKVVPSSASSDIYAGVFEVYDGTYKTGAALVIVPSTSSAAPTHSARCGSFWTASNGNLYFNTSGSTTWRQFAFV